MENTYSHNKVTFPIMPDDAVLTPDHRVIMTNRQLLTKSPNPDEERFESTSVATSTDFINSGQEADTFEQRRQMPTVAGKRPLSKNYNPNMQAPVKKKSNLVEESKKRARENAVAPKPVKQYVNPLERASADELGIKGLVNKKVAQTQHSLGQSISGFDKTNARATNGSLFGDEQKDYFASKHQHRGGFDQVDE